MTTHEMPEIEDVYPVTPLQHGMLFHSLADPSSGVYVEQVWCRIRGDLDAGWFRAAWERVMARHAVLRTSFLFKEVDEPAQVVHRAVDVPLTVTDWEGREAGEQERFFATILRTDAGRGFEPDVAPLMRLLLIRTAPRKYRLLWSFHHALLDGWSVPLVIGELFAAYGSLARGGEPSLPLPGAYRDYIVWLRRQDRQGAERFWREALAGVSGPTPLPMGRIPAGRGRACTAPAEHEVWLDAQVTAELIASAKAHHCTPATLLHAAWALVLARFSGSAEVVFGSTIAGRPHALPDAERMVGLFINTVPVRVTLDRRAALWPWLAQVQASLATVRDHGYCGLDQVQRWSAVPAGTPLFETLVVFENYPVMPVMEGGDDGIVLEDIQSGESTHLPLTVVGGCADRFLVRILRDPEVFDAAPVDAMLGDLVKVLSAFREPRGSIGSVLARLAVTGERSVLSGDIVPIGPGTVLDLIALRVREDAQAPAVVSDAGMLSYGELDRRANRLAHYLATRGIGAECSVGVHVTPTPARIIVVLAVLKCGAAYVPLDHRYPPDRLRFILGATKAALVITDGDGSASLLPADAETLVLGRIEPLLLRMPESAPVVPLDPLGLAYTIFTSGSTGRPKGIQVHHGALRNLTCAFIERFGVDRTSRTLQFFSFGFDGSVCDIFSTLAAGGTLVLPDHQVLASPPDLQSFIRRHAVNAMIMTPTVLTLIDPGAVPSLRSVGAGGEPCYADTALRWKTTCTFHNLYGPTETTVVASSWRQAPDGAADGVLPIGTPFANVRMYVLDPGLHPVPPGVAGELYIGGACVARGYCGRPDLTAAVFVPDPFSPVPGDRMYRSGDRVRLLPDGNLLFLERVDFQVKIRGYRIELGEIEAVLRENPVVADAVVLCRKDGSGGEYLVAYVVRRDGAAVAPETLGAACAHRLPAYMVPSRFVVLEHFPLTANGKVDRPALPEPEGESVTSGETTIAPRTATERTLVAVWERILRRQPVGVRDDFFAIGGHSLLALRLLGEVEKECGRSFSLLTFFQHPTIEVLATLIDSTAPAEAGSPLVELRSGTDLPPLFVVHPTGGSVHWYVAMVHELPHPWPVFGLQAAGLAGEEAPDASIEEMVARYAAAIRAHCPPGPVFIAGWSLGVIVAYALAVRLQHTGYDVVMLAVMDHGPEPPVRRDPADSAELLEDIFGEPLGVDAAFLRTMAEEERYIYVLRLARRHGLVPLTVRRKQFMRYLRLNQMEGHAWRAYQPETYPGRITLFRSEEAAGDPAMGSGWERLARDGVGVVDVPGDHLSMMRLPHVRILASRLDTAMTAAYEQWKIRSCPVTPTYS